MKDTLGNLALQKNTSAKAEKEILRLQKLAAELKRKEQKAVNIELGKKYDKQIVGKSFIEKKYNLKKEGDISIVVPLWVKDSHLWVNTESYCIYETFQMLISNREGNFMCYTQISSIAVSVLNEQFRELHNKELLKIKETTISNLNKAFEHFKMPSK